MRDSAAGEWRSSLRRAALLLLMLILSVACLPGDAYPPLTQPAATTPPPTETPSAWQDLDDTWGPYLAEREWGNPREAVQRSDGWSFTYEKALSTPYRFGEDGIAGITDQNLNVAFAFAFFQTGQPYLTERLYGLDGPSGQYGETILENRVFYENTPTHSYMRYGYSYPYDAARESQYHITIEYAKYNSQTLIAQVTVTAPEAPDNQPLHLVPEVWFHVGGQVTRISENTWDAAYPEGHLVAVAKDTPDAWQITKNEYPKRATINAALVNDGILSNNGEGNKAAWDFVVEPKSRQTQVLRFGLAHADGLATAQANAEHALDTADDLLAMRQAEAQALYADDVTAHQEIYQAALMDLLWNKMYYAYDGSYQPEWKGKVDAHDVILVPDKWEFPWPAMWDTCFQAKAATLADVELAKHDLRLFLSDRWQTETGHVPNVEWSLEGETPPLFAWATWQVYQFDGDRAFLEELFPRLEMHYAFVRRAYDRDNDGLHTGGFMGMDNIPRPGDPDEEQADLSGWVAFFAQDMVRIAAEIGQPERADFYRAEYNQIIAQINAELWDEESGFYYDRNNYGSLLEKSYTGLIPFIAGAPDAAQTERIIAHLTNPAEFWSPYGIRSLSADSAIYEPGYSETGWKNSNWRGPIWMPINYLLVQRLEETHPEIADQLRANIIANIEAQWQTTGRFWEYYHAETGEGLGADHQTGWTALVANLIHEKYAKR
ncbi:MAG: trehalase family glycosidase [Anaerolineae bacterium]